MKPKQPPPGISLLQREPTPKEAAYLQAMEEQQSQVNQLLARAVVFSFLWLAGLGSCYSVVLATKARRIIKNSDGVLTGMGWVWLCYLLGGGGVLLVSSVIITAFLNG